MLAVELDSHEGGVDYRLYFDLDRKQVNMHDYEFIHFKKEIDIDIFKELIRLDKDLIREAVMNNDYNQYINAKTRIETSISDIDRLTNEIYRLYL